MFVVGEKVEYIGPEFVAMARAYGQIVPVRHTPYTVRATDVLLGEETILLKEIVNIPRQWANGVVELQMNANLFRPIVARKTDISVFLKMLTPSQVDA